MVELIATVVGRESDAIKRMLRFAPNDRAGATRELDAHLSTDEALRTLYIGCKILVQSAIPLSVVDEACILACNNFFETALVAAQCQTLQRLMSSMQHSSSGSFIDFARFDAH